MDTSWIWLDGAHFPSTQTSRRSAFVPAGEDQPDQVAEFRRSYTFPLPVKEATFTVAADTTFHFYEGGRFLFAGPHGSGGDFAMTATPRRQYPVTYTMQGQGNTLALSVLVGLGVREMMEFSSGFGGLSVQGRVTLEDGRVEHLGTDTSWEGRRHNGYCGVDDYNGCIAPGAFFPAVAVPARWETVACDLPCRVEETVLPALRQETETGCVLTFDRIYSAYVVAENTGCEEAELVLHTFEVEGQGGKCFAARWRLAPGECHRSLKLYSVGGLRLEGNVKNVKITLQFTHMPDGKQVGYFRCSDERLNRLYDVCRHTLRMCRQGIHLDSPTHQEPLACTGDYYIETLMESVSVGDLSLAAWDVRRTAELLREQDGRMFHTTYSLIWVQMLHFVVERTDDEGLLRECEDALALLLHRFDGYLGDNGLYEKAPDYMFVDWLTVDGYSMHHPPKALGQTVLCAFGYRALVLADGLYRRLGRTEKAARCRARARALHDAVNLRLFDGSAGMYRSGLTTPNAVPEGQWLPKNAERPYFTLHANVLCVLYGLCPSGMEADLMARVMEDGSLPDYQPYFAHFVLEALAKTGLYGKYGKGILSRFVQMTDACDKGLQEGWISPGPGYRFDHSHAWGGTPVWQLPMRHLELRRTGDGRYAIRPRLWGLAYADIAVPLREGLLQVHLERGSAPRITAPAGVTVTVQKQ